MALNYEALIPLVQKAVRTAHASFPSHHSVDDTEQAVWLWVVENESTVRHIAADTERPEVQNKPVYDLMVKAANTHLKKEDAASFRYSEEDAFDYSENLVKQVLEVIFQYEDWQSFASALDAMPRGRKDPATAGNNLATYADVKSAVEKLPDIQYNIIVWRYKYRYTFENIGTELGTSGRAAQGRHDTAVRAIQRLLGRKELSELREPSDGHLRPSTRAEAYAMLESQYEG